ncbi:GRIM-19 protein-domain-containing protein [Cyathus striatus]|nr:GRIM-19 protein-domain-containing protein [Cyathus striatus]
MSLCAASLFLPLYCDILHARNRDLPPPGGFEAVKYKRNLPLRGPGSYAILGGVTAICAYGFYRVGQGSLEKRELQREKVWSRIHLVPLLMAESDRDVYRRQQASLAREKAVMKDVPGWECYGHSRSALILLIAIRPGVLPPHSAGKSVYNNPRYSQPDTYLL